ncbi:Ig-like domain-containing protein [Paenibacillus antarcticus]|uniref:Dockerin domain-containing protein n=1 Tax=Paenibacillus antarcticus TaxID=253703 RepID=A0A168PKG3_9BACL|nr:Ig-like domain-containing protein [Paenibacillus antarcticus]OAB46851.1 hypothetical protein PBAT_09305 [Paenibacillus antarcticus]
MRQKEWLRKTVGMCLITGLLLSSFVHPVSAQQLENSQNKIVSPTNDVVSNNLNRRINFNDNWRFQRETSGSISGAQAPGFDDLAWRQLTLPHDWSIELDFNANSPATHEGGYLDGGIGWYRKTFTAPETMKGKSISIDFDGVYMNSTTYLNGQLLGTYPYGYNAFSYDISDKLYTDGRENVLVVKVNNTQPSSRWYSGSGIYRNVYLTVTDPIHVARYGTYVTTPNLDSAYTAGRADVNLKTEINNASGKSAEVKVKSTIYNADGTAVSTVESETRTAMANTLTMFEDNTVIHNPTLWSTDNPYRYKVVTEVIVGGQTVDTYETPFGVRYFKFDSNDGFSLNGQYMKLYGVSMHHDLGSLGAAVNARAVERQLQIMKDMGVNAIRVTHNPASPELLEAANNLGLLVVEEAFDAWNQGKKTYDYSRFFSTWAEHDIKEMVDRGKNEPSIIMWSIGNEIYDTTSASGVTTARNLVRWIKEVDPTRPTTIGEDKTRGDKVNVTPINSYVKEIFNAVDIVGLNYSENNYAGYHTQNPEWKIYGAETSSATRSRGVYTHPYSYNQSTKYADMQQSSYDNDYVGWGRTAEDAWKRDRDLKNVAGQFIWTGFDYIGEPTPYYNAFPSKSSYFGAVDTAGFPKDIFYYYQSQWKKEPMVHLLPHWNWTAGESVRVLAYTNAHTVELVLNGTSLGVRSYVNKTTSWGAPYKETTEGKTYLEWAVPFKAGTLEAIAKDEAGKVIARDKVVTAGEPASVKLTADRQVITADGKDVSFITVDVVDREGNIVPTANNLVNFTLSGNGQLVGVDNGDGASVERYKDNKRKVFSGKALAIIQSDKQTGEMVLSASSAGLAGDTVKVFTIANGEGNLQTVVGFEPVNVITQVNKEPVLPESVKVYYSDASVATKTVTWSAINSSLYAQIGQFAVEGTVEGITKKVSANVTVKGVVAVKPIAVVTKVGVLPNLPSQVSLLFSDNTEKNALVTWEVIPEGKVSEAGSFVIHGSVTETDIKAQANIRVTNESQSVNIMLRNGGSSFPKLEATFTNPADNLNHINDGIKSYTETPVNRWTNWTRTPRDSGDSITVDFGTTYSINNLDLFVFTDSGTVVPRTVTVQYWNGTAWVDVQNLTQPTPYVVQKNEIRFDSVMTEKLKFHMTPSQTGKYVALTEVEIHTDQIIMGTTANLSGITVNGKILSDFAVAKMSYELTLPFGSDLPKIEAIGADHSTVTILPALSFPGTSRIMVTSENGMVSNEYSIHMKMEAAAKEIDRLESITEVVDKGVLPVLPKTVVAHYNDGSFGDVKVIWDAIDPALYGKYGEFTVFGSVDGTAIKASAKITVKGALAVENITKAVLLKQKPDLPKKLTVYFNDGTEEQKVVSWANIPSERLDTIGIFDLIGTVEGVELNAKATIRVTDEAGKEKNISVAKNGYEYPKAEASFTNNEATSKDTIESINDGVISYGDAPQNRWTNWQRTPRNSDWVSITFGDFEPVEYDVDNMEIHWFADSGTSYPASLKIQYKSGDNWIDVTNLQSNPSTPTVGEANLYTFDSVRTSALRVDMTARAGLSLAITEINILNKSAVLNSEPVVSDIQLDGSSILNQFTQVNGNYEASIQISKGNEIPEVTATGGDNTSITIVPVVNIPSTAKVIAKSEDGKKTIVYNIHYSLKDEGTPEQVSISLNGPVGVQPEEQFTVNVGLNHVTTPIQAQDIIVRYDAEKFEFILAQSKLEHVKIIEASTNVSGQVHLLVVSTGAEHAITTDGAVIEMTMRAKALTQKDSGKVETTQAIISDAEGNETNAALASIMIDISSIIIPGTPDVNGDGKVSIGDLSIVAAHYGKTKDSSDWNQVKRADVNGDGKIDITDLAFVAKKILE